MTATSSQYCATILHTVADDYHRRTGFVIGADAAENIPASPADPAPPPARPISSTSGASP